jgi:hypothetical protein
MALPCRNATHRPAFHPWPTAPANLTILPCEQFCQWCAEPGTAKKANNLRAHAAPHLVEHPEFSIVKSTVGRPTIAIRHEDSATASASARSTPL